MLSVLQRLGDAYGF